MQQKPQKWWVDGSGVARSNSSNGEGETVLAFQPLLRGIALSLHLPSVDRNSANDTNIGENGAYSFRVIGKRE